MNWKLIFIGGVAMYVAWFVIGMITGQVIHEGILDEAYRQTAAFWRPELNQDPPDIAALMPRWIATGLIGAFLVAGVYGAVRGSFSGPGWQRGAKYGFAVWLIAVAMMLGWSGVFNLPNNIWMWWGIDGAINYLVGGAVLGWVADKFAPETG